MDRQRQLIIIAAVCAFTLVGVAAGWFAALDGAMRDVRFSLTNRPATGEIILVEIDAEAVANTGVGVGTRGLYARAIEELFIRGARSVTLGISVSSREPDPGDAALVRTLQTHAGRVRTITTHRGESGGDLTLAFPSPLFASIAPPVYIDAVMGRDRLKGTYDTTAMHDGWVIESFATALTPSRDIRPDSFFVDYAIDYATVPRVTLSNLFDGNTAPEFFLDRDVVIGLASYAQISTQTVPRYGMLSTPAVELLAAESVRQDRMLRSMGGMPVGIIIIAGTLVFAILRPSMTLRSALLGSAAYSGVLEFVALVLQVHSGLLLETAGIHVAQAGLIIAAFWHELEQKSQSLSKASRERDAMRSMLERVVADNFDGVVVIDRNKTIRAASRLAEDLVGPGLVGKRLEEVLPAPFRHALERALDHGDAMDAVGETAIAFKDVERVIEFVVTLSDIDADESTGRVACLTFRDVTERRHDEERMSYLAQHDPLTGAASRARFLDEVGKQLIKPADRFRGVGVFLIGLSRLKTINDTLGHAHGDALLKQVVSRLDLLGPISVARLEGNAFAVLRQGLTTTEDGRAFADQLIETISRPYHLDGHQAIIGARVGMSDSDLSGSSPEAIVTHASLALSIASDQQGNCAVTFSKDMDARIKTKQDMEIALRAALSNNEFTVHYQPQVDLETGEIIGVEALTRWTHPLLGTVSPAEFIPAAEETGLILELGRWVLDTACAEVATWDKPVRLSVNVSPLQFDYGDIVGDVEAALAASGLAPNRLQVEITESLLVTETSRAATKLLALREIGVGVALDDFGTGYSSLSYLGRLPIDTIKIDQSFIRGLPQDAEASAIVRTVLMLSESLGKNVVAEGIETQDQAWLLRLAGCKIGQGYYFARPAPAAQIVALLSGAEQDKFTTRMIG